MASSGLTARVAARPGSQADETSRTPRPKTSRATWPVPDPSASRTANSCWRDVAWYAITPYSPIAASTSVSVANSPTSQR